MFKIRVPGSKSITNRALILAALARGRSEIFGALQSEDTEHAKNALRLLGVRILKKAEKTMVSGTSLRQSRRPLNCGNSGTTLRFLTAVLAAQPFRSILTGDKRMLERPIGDLADALKPLGARITFLKRQGFPPLAVEGPLSGGSVKIRVDVSSQFLSGLLMAAPLARGKVVIETTGVIISKPYVEMTIALMASFGVQVKQEGGKFTIAAGQKYSGEKLFVEGDASSAGYFWGISALTGEAVDIPNIPSHSLQGDVRLKKILSEGFLSTVSPLHIHAADFPDAAMTLAVLAAFRNGKTTLTGLANLRVKECDRLAAMTNELRKIGAKVKQLRDGWEIFGNPGNLKPARIRTYSDHRMAMCFGMAECVLPGIKIENPHCVKKTYPDFWKQCKAFKEHLLKKNIILTGMRGSGKSKLGALLGRSFGKRFVDLDAVIEHMAERPIAEIVSRRGWKYFRMLERRAVKKTASLKGVVIATGGGTLMYPANVKTLKANGKIVYLSCRPETLRRRLFGKTDRPSLTEKKGFLAEILEVFRERHSKYESIADATIDVTLTTRDKRQDLNKKLVQLSAAVRRLGLL